MIDAETQVLRMLADLRRAIVEHGINAAGSLDGLRRTLHHLFERSSIDQQRPIAPIMRLSQYRESVVELPGAFLEPHLRAQAVEGYDEQVRPIVRRATLATTEAEGLPT